MPIYMRSTAVGAIARRWDLARRWAATNWNSLYCGSNPIFQWNWFVFQASGFSFVPFLYFGSLRSSLSTRTSWIFIFIVSFMAGCLSLRVGGRNQSLTFSSVFCLAAWLRGRPQEIIEDGTTAFRAFMACSENDFHIESMSKDQSLWVRTDGDAVHKDIGFVEILLDLELNHQVSIGQGNPCGQGPNIDVNVGRWRSSNLYIDNSTSPVCEGRVLSSVDHNLLLELAIQSRRGSPWCPNRDMNPGA